MLDTFEAQVDIIDGETVPVNHRIRVLVEATTGVVKVFDPDAAAGGWREPTHEELTQFLEPILRKYGVFGFGNSIHRRGKVLINGLPVMDVGPVFKTVVSYEDIVALAGLNGTPSVVYYKGGPEGKDEGILTPGKSVVAVGGTAFEVVATNNA